MRQRQDSGDGKQSKNQGDIQSLRAGVINGILTSASGSSHRPPPDLRRPLEGLPAVPGRTLANQHFRATDLEIHESLVVAVEVAGVIDIENRDPLARA